MLPSKNLEHKIGASWTLFCETLSLERYNHILQLKILSFILLLYNVTISYDYYIAYKFIHVAADQETDFSQGSVM